MKKAKAIAGAAIAASLMVLAPASAYAGQNSAQLTCHVTQGDWGMWCENMANIPAYQHRNFNSAIVGRVKTTTSYFACWGRGEQNGRNSIWYWAQTDDTGAWGNVASVHVKTPQDPMSQMRQC
ncbi:hypothetical protein JOF53_005291 [Crossiella equi]|uniref:Uncharacterized protein n=1 Tax=Crossiella equi TaxID=130796 RepID=A0ABS5AIL5_9PSEU|nr:hypothetical protein [Crossiella equi]MBP2476419.1 hypothetical protein [Crossiella equi]